MQLKQEDNMAASAEAGEVYPPVNKWIDHLDVSIYDSSTSLIGLDLFDTVIQS